MKAVIILNGDKPSQDISGKLQDSLVICADGAYDWAEEMGIYPDALIGDFDSIKKTGKAKNIIGYKADKDATDGQLCLDYAVQNNCSEIEIYGGAGGRDDHYISNLALLIRGRNLGCNVTMITDACEITCVKNLYEKELGVGTIISLVPICGNAHILNTEGLKYGLHDAVLSFDNTLGMSNVAVDTKVKVEIDGGMILVYAVKIP